jgi:hypothetical protein
MNSRIARNQIEAIRHSASETTARSFDVLNAIDQTLDMLNWLSEHARADANYLVQETEKLKNLDLSPIDPEILCVRLLSPCNPVLDALTGCSSRKEMPR